MQADLRTLIATTALSLLLVGCAQTGPPLPPSLELPKPPTDLRANRKGNRVTLTWSEPALTTDRQSVRYLGPTLVCRSLQPDHIQPEMTECGKPVTTVAAPAAVVPRFVRSLAPPIPRPRLSPTLCLDHPNHGPSRRNYLCRRSSEPQRRGAGLSNRVHVPAVLTLPPPANLTAN